MTEAAEMKKFQVKNLLLCVSLLFSLVSRGQKNVHFTDAYVREHQDKFEVYIPEIHELANILVAISRVGQVDSNMVDMSSNYYQEVLRTFMPFSNHPIIDTINHHIISHTDVNSYWYYYALKMNACGYIFDHKGGIVNMGYIRHMGFNNVKDPIEKHRDLIADFAFKSNFRVFYKSHQSYYDSLIMLYRQLNPIDKMQRWLESHFGFAYGNYTVLFLLWSAAPMPRRNSGTIISNRPLCLCAQLITRKTAARNTMRCGNRGWFSLRLTITLSIPSPKNSEKRSARHLQGVINGCMMQTEVALGLMPIPKRSSMNT